MLVQKVLKFRGENCRFVKLRANEDHMWFESSARLSALTSELLLNPLSMLLRLVFLRTPIYQAVPSMMHLVR